jgi:LmbE family N-acetylglucosaminyl deacetylase
MKIWLSPHSDDESLFGAYTIIKKKPNVLLFKSKDLNEERFNESMVAMSILGANAILIGDLVHLPELKDVECAWVPDPKSKHPFHREVARMAMKTFPKDKIIFYSTYRSSHDLEPYGDIMVEATEEMKALKLKALECYKTQIKATPRHFQTKSKDEYYLNGNC